MDEIQNITPLEENTVPARKNILMSKLKIIAYVAGCLLLLYFVVQIAVRKEKFQDNKVLLDKIDSLDKVSKQLREDQAKLLLRDSAFKGKINEVDAKLDDVAKNKTVIREYHHDVINKAREYKNPAQIDSFLRNRYPEHYND